MDAARRSVTTRIGFSKTKSALVLPSFRGIEQSCCAALIEPEALARYRGNATAMKNQAVFEIPVFLNKILEQAR